MRNEYEPPLANESEHDWLARRMYWANRHCAESHATPCEACVKRKAEVRAGKWSHEPGSAARFLIDLEAELIEKGKSGARVDGAFPRGRASKASVYVLLDEHGNVLYVGKAKDVRARIWGKPNGHAASKPWFPEVRGVFVYDYETEGLAFDAEARWIHDLSPRYNKAIPNVPVVTPRYVDMWAYESPEEVRA